MNENERMCQELQRFIGRRVRFSLEGSAWTTGFVRLERVEIRGERVWFDANRGMSWTFPDNTNRELLLIELDDIIGTYDFLLEPNDKFPPIYAAFDNYGIAPIRARKMCNCGRCAEVVNEAPRGTRDGIPVDDIGIGPKTESSGMEDY